MTFKINQNNTQTTLPSGAEFKAEQKEWFKKEFPSPLAFYSNETNDMKKLASQKGTSKERTNAAKGYFEKVYSYVAKTGANKKS